nr:inositol monophosphatase [Desulfobacterales bacterium]
MDILDEIKVVALKAVGRAGEILCDYWGSTLAVEKKGSIDLVSEADIESEKAIIGIIHENFPDHSIIAEEKGSILGESRYQWVIDPLDGTTNYTHTLPIFSVSLAFLLDGELVLGIVMNPVLHELFLAQKGRGATLNNRKICVSNTQVLAESLLVTGFPYNLKNLEQNLIPRFKRCILASQGVRRLGSAALDLCYVACGRFDGFWEENLAPWDTAAGTLIAQESGALVTDFSCKPYDLGKKEILATNGRIHKELAALLMES